MTGGAPASAGDVQRSCALVAAALSDGRRHDARLVTGEHRAFGLERDRHGRERPVPRPRTRLDEPDAHLRHRPAVRPVEGPARRATASTTSRRGSSSPWRSSRVGSRSGGSRPTWAGLLPECERVLGQLDVADPDLDGAATCSPRRRGWPGRRAPCRSTRCSVGCPTLAPPRPGLAASLRRRYGRMPWSSRQQRPPAHPLDPRRRRRRRAQPEPAPAEPARGRRASRSGPTSGSASRIPSGTCGPSGSSPTTSRCSSARSRREPRRPPQVSPAVRRWFEEHTHRAMRNGLEDGSDLDIARYVDHFIDAGSRRRRRASRVPRPRARLPRRHHRAAARRQLVARRAPRDGLRARARLRRLRCRRR